MKIIVPMAGRGSRLRPHTLTIPKPLIPIAGKPIVQRLVEDIAKVCEEKITEIAFIVGDFGAEVEERLIKVAESLGAKGSIYHQDQPLGTAHAIMCAKDSLDGPVIVAFADTLFKADFKLDSDADGIIWVNKVDNPAAFGVVNLDDKGVIREFVEKPSTFVSDLAIIGIYFFKDGAYLKSELQYLLDNKIMDRGEYQITDALENMKAKGTRFKPGTVDHWLDCGNKDVTVNTNSQYLEFIKSTDLVHSSAKIENSTIIEPCFIDADVVISNSVVGPHVSIGKNSSVLNSVIKESIVQENSLIENKVLNNSMVGNHAKIHGRQEDLSVGDYNVVKH